MSKSSHKTSKKRCSIESWKLPTIQEGERTEWYRFESQIFKKSKTLNQYHIHNKAMVRTEGNRVIKHTPLLSELCAGEGIPKLSELFFAKPK